MGGHCNWQGGCNTVIKGPWYGRQEVEFSMSVTRGPNVKVFVSAPSYYDL